RRWAAVAVGFAGVLLMTPAEGGSSGWLGWVVAIPVGAALFSAFRDVTTRRIGAADAALTVLFWSTLVTVAGAAVTLAFGTHWPAPAQWGLFALGGLLGTAAHFLMIRSFQLAEAATVAPFKYLSLVYAGIYGFLLWGDVPGPSKLVGMALVAGSGLYVLHRETRLARRARVAARAAALAAED
ncbi:MAG TPA: DMT family transporter, partial [Alphaproteobacteria bacterium]|nr:DMT family transporter [Alphaproteobacteria bacterium]